MLRGKCMKSGIRKMLSCLLALVTVFAMCPLCPKATEPPQTGKIVNIDELKAAIANAEDGDIITLPDTRGSSPYRYEIGSGEELVIDKSITIDLNGNYIFMIDSASTIRISENVTVNIINDLYTNGYIQMPMGSAVEGRNAFVVENGATLNIRGNITCNGTLKIESGKQPDGKAGSINVYSGSYYYKNYTDKQFDVNDGTLVIYSGIFQDNPEKYMASGTEYIIENENYEVLRPISGNFKKILTDGKIVVNAIKPVYDAANQEEAAEAEEEAATMVNVELEKYNESVDELSFYAYCLDLDNNKFLVVYTDYSEKDYMTPEKHIIEVEFKGNISSSVLSRVEKYAARIPDNFNYGGKSVCINDLEVINLFTTGFDSNDLVCMANMANYSGELKSIFENTNIQLRVHNSMAGATDDFTKMSAGNATISADGTVCCAFPWFLAVAKQIIYVPDQVALDEDSLIAAAKERIDSYLGDSGIVNITKGGLFESIGSEDLQNMIIGNLELQTKPRYYFNFEIDNNTYKFFIIPDSSKMVTPECKTVDITTDVSVETQSSKVPLDASIRSNYVTDNEKCNYIKDTLGTDKIISLDIKLYSGSNDEYVSKLDNSTFDVYVPLGDEFKDMELSAYYIDDEGNVEEHPIEVNNGIASFETNHFSIYTIAKTGKNICNINGKAHKLTAVPAKSATAQAEGNKAYWICDCGKWFMDADGKTEITDKASVIIPKLKENENDIKEDTKPNTENKDNKNDKAPNTGDEIWMLFALMMLLGTGLMVTGKLSGKIK